MVVLSHFSQYSVFIIAKTRTKSKCKIPPWGTFFRDFPCLWKIQRNDQSGRGPARRRDGKMPDRREKSGSFAPTWKPQRQNRLAEYVGNFLSMWRWCPSLQKCPPKIQNSLDFMTSLSYYTFSDPTKWGDIIGGQKKGRPTDNPKDTSLKVYLDKDTARKLDECITELGVSKSEAVRRGIRKMYDDLDKNGKGKRRTPTKNDTASPTNRLLREATAA